MRPRPCRASSAGEPRRRERGRGGGPARELGRRARTVDGATCDGEAGVKEQREVRRAWLKPGYAKTEGMVVSPKPG